MQATHTQFRIAGVHEAHHEDAGFWRTYVFSTDHKVIGIQYGVTALCFLLFGFCLMLMMRWQIAHPGQPVPIVGPLLAARSSGERSAAKGIDVAGPLQFLRRDARDDHGLPGHRAAGLRRVRQLRRAAADRRAGHGVPAREHGELPGLCDRRRDHVRQLLHSRRRGAGGLDFLFAAGDVDSDATARPSGSSAWCS